MLNTLQVKSRAVSLWLAVFGCLFGASGVGHIGSGGDKEIGNDRQLRDLWFTLMRQFYKMDITSFGEDARGNPNALLNEILL